MERTFINCSRSLSRSLKSNHASKAAVRSFVTTSRPTTRSPKPSQALSERQCRYLHLTPSKNNPSDSRSHRRGPPRDENSQTDFSALDVLRNTAAPATSIDACTSEGFALNNNMRISGCGVLLVGGEVFRWRPWLSSHRKEGTIQAGATGDDAMTGHLLNAKGQWEVPDEAWGLLDMVWPKPGMA